MKISLLFILLGLSTATFAMNYSLKGKWRLEGERFSKPLIFMEFDGVTHEYTQQKFVNPNGTLQYTIDQALKLVPSSDGGYEGTVDFYDSRGCSFTDLPVIVSFISKEAVNVLMTVPRYKVLKITTGHSSSYDGPLYCQGVNPYPYRYVCGRQSDLKSTRTECELLETIEVPVRLNRMKVR
jgi:hypothetical protein